MSRDPVKSGRAMGTGLQKNANLITGFVAALILVAGLGVTSGRDSWWVSAALVGALFMGLFLILNARAVIKAGLATLAVAFTGQIALVMGSIVAPQDTLGIVWLIAQFFLYLLTIAVSYVVPGTRSRWTGTAISSFVALASTAALAGYIGVDWAIVASLAIGLAAFLFYYRGIGALLEHHKLMPKSELSEIHEEALVRQIEAEGWSARRLEKKRFRRASEVSYLAWSEERAYVLHPVQLSSKFSISPGRKSSKLVHGGASINNWLLRLTHKHLPLWRSRNAPMMLVLLDIDSSNGTRPEAIGVALPDTQKKLPVGIYPAKGVLAGSKSKKAKGLMADIEAQYAGYLPSLKPRHLEALEGIGIARESEYLEPTSPTGSV